MNPIRTRYFRHGIAATIALLGTLIAFCSIATATTIERVVTPRGIEVWLVRETSVPLISLEFAFRGGAGQDPADKPGVSHMVAALIDEGAGELDAQAYHGRLEDRAIELSFSSTRDYFRGSLRTLTEHRDEGVELLRLALTAPRFDADAVDRIRAQVMARLQRNTTSPDDIANKRWWQTAFGTHPYGRPVEGTLDSVPAIVSEDLRTYVRNDFARDTLKIAIVGDIDAAAASKLVDQVFGSLPEKAKLTPVPTATPSGLGQRIFVDLDVPQAVMTFGGAGIARKDPDFIPAYVVNHILGGGSFSSRLYREVREERGLAYGVRSSLAWYDSTALFTGGTATRFDRAKEALAIIEQEIRRMAERGPTEEELAKAKSYLKGAYPLGFDSSTKIAGQLVQIQIDELGIDYINRRNGLIDAVTLTDTQRVAKRLLTGDLLVTMVGRQVSGGTKGTGN
jgi:zinc protease